MPTYEIRNKRSRMVIGEVRVESPEELLNEWMRESGMTLEDIFRALGGSMEAVYETLEIAEVEPRGSELVRGVATAPLRKGMPPRRRLFCEEVA